MGHFATRSGARKEGERQTMPGARLSVVVTRRLPEAVETRMTELFDVELRPDDRPMPVSYTHLTLPTKA
jgi:hypothetical protein